MPKNPNDVEAPAATLTDEFARQRWELFHRAIAHAKRTNDEALLDADGQSGDGGAGPAISIVR